MTNVARSHRTLSRRLERRTPLIRRDVAREMQDATAPIDDLGVPSTIGAATAASLDRITHEQGAPDRVPRP